MVVLLGMAYKLYGGLSWMQAVFYGVGAAVIGIITMSAYKLTTKSVSKLFRFDKKELVVMDTLSCRHSYNDYHKIENVLLFVGAGFIYMMIKAPPAWVKK